MSLRFQINHSERLIVGVSSGVLTLKDLLAFWREVEDSKAASYHKLVDVMGGTLMLSTADIEAFRERLTELPKGVHAGPLALVTSHEHEEIATLFSELTSDQRPVKVFHSIHEARKWLHSMPMKR
jgi:hypothetical protein